MSEHRPRHRPAARRRSPQPRRPLRHRDGRRARPGRLGRLRGRRRRLRGRRRRGDRPRRRPGHPGVHRRARAHHRHRARPHRPRPVRRPLAWTRPSPAYARSPPPVPPTGSCSATAGTPPAGPSGRPPTRAELDEATGGRPLYLSRIDVHSAVVTTALLDLVPGVTALPATARRPADRRRPPRRARRRPRRASTPAQRTEAQRAALARAASLGIGSVHECGGPRDLLRGRLHRAAAARRRGAGPAGRRLLGRAGDEASTEGPRPRRGRRRRRPVRRRRPRLAHRLPARAVRRRRRTPAPPTWTPPPSPPMSSPAPRRASRRASTPSATPR